MNNFKTRMRAKMKEQGITASQFLDNITDLLCDTSGMTIKELQQDLREHGIDPDEQWAGIQELLHKYGINIPEENQ